jgi:TetR/AcrR family transcriptional repressor of bet genes
MTLKTTIRDVRRRDLQRAAYEVVVERGFGGATITGVASKLGMSRGTVYQYFPEKQDLFEAAVRYTNAHISEIVIQKLKGCRGPMDRLHAIIEGCFADDLFTASTAQFWLSFCAQTVIEPRFARLQSVLMGRMKSNLLNELRQMQTPRPAADLADEISMLLDGLWMRRGMAPETIPPERAIAIVKNHVAATLGALPVS